MEAAGSEDAGGHLQLIVPVGDDFPAVEADSPVVHLPGNDLGDVMELRVADESQLHVPDVVQRHGVDLTQSVLAIEHPAVGSRQQGIGDIAQPRCRGCSGLGRWSGALDPLALQVVGDHRSLETAGPSIGNCDRSSVDDCGLGQKVEVLAIGGSSSAAIDSRVHEVQASSVEGGESLQSRQGFGSVNVRIPIQSGPGDRDGGGHGPSSSRRWSVVLR